MPLTPAGSALALGGLVAVGLYVALGLPRLPARRAWMVTAAAAALAAASVITGFVGGALSWPLVALLAGHGGWALGQRRRGPPGAALPERRPVESPAAAGDRPPAPMRSMLGRYRLEGEIGRGSMGAVYLGRDPQIGRQVAIKTMALGRGFKPDKAQEARERFFREAESAGRLQHPDIVTIFDAGQAQELSYIAMEFVRGHDLARHAAPGRLLPVQQVLEIAARVADALAYAHSQGIVHRDIKPANVMVDPDTGSVKVMDFGVARITDASRTRTGLVLGTPNYMSPEQMAGRPVDGRSDLYSLGVMLFQLLTGELPHRSDSMAEMLHQITHSPAPDVRTLRPELPEALAHVVALALEKRPEVRYADGRQLAEDLRTVIVQLSSAPEPSPFERTEVLHGAEPRHNSGT